MKVVEKTYEGARVNNEAFLELCKLVDKSLKGLSLKGLTPKEFVELEPDDFIKVGKRSSVVSRLRMNYNLRFKGLSAPENIGISSVKVFKI